MKRKARERSIKQLPIWLLLSFVLAFAIQVYHSYVSTVPLKAEFAQLSQPLSVGLYQSIAQGSEKLWSYLLSLKVQLHDNQRGRHENYRNLDYKILSHWLLILYQLNPESSYPAFLASRVYSQVNDKEKISMMITVIEKMFDQNPRLNWRRMTEASLLAKHQLNDLNLALKIASKVAELPRTIKMPFWARDMKFILLDELNQLESAQILISSMLQSGAVTDRDEIRFLQSRLLKIQQQMLSDGQ